MSSYVYTYAQDDDSLISRASDQEVSWFSALATRLAHKVHVWKERRRTLRILSELDDRALKDIGVNRQTLVESVDELLSSPGFALERKEKVTGRLSLAA